MYSWSFVVVSLVLLLVIMSNSNNKTSNVQNTTLHFKLLFNIFYLPVILTSSVHGSAYIILLGQTVLNVKRNTADRDHRLQEVYKDIF